VSVVDGRAAPGRPEGTRAVAWFHCFAGIAGDMALASLLDAGADLGEVRRLLERLPIGGWQLDVEPVLRGGVAASRAVVTVADNVVVRTYAHIVGLVEEARLPPRVTRRALATFAALAEVEARLHRRPVEHVHFHEVGGHDAVVDIVGTAAALEVLGVDEVRASPVATGTGMVRAAHGLLPNPPPAVVALLEGVPIWGRNLSVELTTPTGAALLAALSSGYGPMPAMRVTGQGFGAGSRDLDELPNCTQVVLGVAVDRRIDTVPVPTRPGIRIQVGAKVDGHDDGDDDGHPDDGPDGHPGGLLGGDVDADAGQPVVLLETNVDDATGEQLAHAVAMLLDAGALDVWLTPVLMKKGRPGSVVHVLTELSRVRDLRRLLRRTTGSLGVRMTVGERWPAARTMDAITVDGQLIRIKVSSTGIKAEYDDVAAAARRTGGSLRDLSRRAEVEWLAAHTPSGEMGPDPVGSAGYAGDTPGSAPDSAPGSAPDSAPGSVPSLSLLGDGVDRMGGRADRDAPAGDTERNGSNEPVRPDDREEPDPA
jgi:pyridinium-3,5-bisthiocarboxylic acid mononucleotide nickel chelatase